MKKNKIKQTIVLGFISILGVALFIGGYILKDSFIHAGQIKNDPTIDNVTLIKNVPTEKEWTKKSTAKKTDNVVALSHVKDTVAPIIHAPEITVEQYSQFDIYEGVSAFDTKDGDLTTKLTTSETLDTSIPGDYSIPLTVSDSSGNVGKANRMIHVVSKHEPVSQVSEQADTTFKPAVESTTTPEIPATPAYAPMTITINGQTIPYQNGGQGSGQSVIDSNPSGVVSTWGGAPVQSGNDGANTHFIGHNPGAFSTIFSLAGGSQIVVTDGNGTPTTYTVQTLLQLDDYGDEVDTGTSYWDLAVGTGGGERITLQSCINDSINLIVIAYK